MKENDITDYLTQGHLFELFKQQLKKDFESSGCNADFVDVLPLGFEQIKLLVKDHILDISKLTPSLLPILLYRVDVSEIQISQHQRKYPAMDFEESLAELIVKRILQKIILKKTFSE